MTLGRAVARRPEESIVLGRLRIVVAEVTQSIEAKAEVEHQRRARVERLISDLLLLLEDSNNLRSAMPPLESVTGPLAALIAPQADDMVSGVRSCSETMRALERTNDIFREALRLRGPTALEQLREFEAWLTKHRDALVAKGQAFSKQFDTDLRADARRQAEIAEDWSEASGDGIV